MNLARLVLILVAALLAGCATPKPQLDVIWLGTPPAAVERMLELAKVNEHDLLYDLGCGDARIPIAAAKKLGTKAVCVELDPQKADQARRSIQKVGLGPLIEVRQKDLFEQDLQPATVLTLYLLRPINNALIPKIQKMKAGSRVVSYRFEIPDAIPEKIEALPPGQQALRIFLYTVPLRIKPAALQRRSEQ